MQSVWNKIYEILVLFTRNYSNNLIDVGWSKEKTCAPTKDFKPSKYIVEVNIDGK